MVTELQKSRAFIGQTDEQRRNLENIIKKRYVLSDYEIDGKLGYKIYDNEKKEDIYFSPNSRLTLEKRYLEKDDERKVTENVLDLFTRVSVNIAEADLKYEPEKDIKPVAEGFLESLIYKEFMPNTPTLCNAGRALQQLSACFVLPIEDYMATDDIGEDPEKQGNGIFDALRYMAMIHKSGGGTGFNFSHLRPKTDRISTTFGSSSGPVSFMKIFDEATNEVNQGGFRRGANMGILNYYHPDIFEFINEKAKRGTMTNFNLSVGVDKKFMDLVENDGYFKLINPKNEKTIALEKRVWKEKNLLSKKDSDYDSLFGELRPSLVVDNKKVIDVCNNKEVGKIDEDGSVLISSRALFNQVTENAWETGCPGIIFLDKLEKNNKTKNVGKIESTNPCGEQPLLPYEACNLGGINLASCVKEGKVDYEEIGKRTEKGVHFLDNTIDVSKFPFQKIYGMVHGNRKIGLGLMGWAEMLAQLKIPYDSEEAVELAKKISNYVTEAGRKESEKFAEKRGVFPNWKGSDWEKEGKKVRNATITTIAPNGTTGMIADATGGIEPFFKLAFKKTCMDGRELIYGNLLFEKELREIIEDKSEIERILKKIEEKGSIQNYEILVGDNIKIEDLKKIYKTAHDIAPEWHVKMQAAFQSGIDNAVSKTVNLPEEATIDDFAKIYKMAFEEDCVGVTAFRDKSKKGVYSGLESKIELIQNDVKLSPALDKKAQTIKYKIKRIYNKDSLHVILTSDLFVDDKTKKAYFIPAEIFQERAPLGDANSVSFQQAGMDRTEIFRGPNPDYAELVSRIQSASSNEEEGLGPKKIKSKEHAVGIVLEDYLLRNGIIGNNELGKLVNLIEKSKLRKVEENSDEYESIMSQVRVGDIKLIATGNHGKLGRSFVCGASNCGSTEYTYISGCSHPVCAKCGWDDGSCG